MSQGFTKDYLVKATGETTVLVNGTPVASTSGTEIDFVIPSGVKNIKVLFDQVSISGTSDIQIRLGDSGGIESTGYESVDGRYNATGAATQVHTDGFNLWTGASTNDLTGILHLTLINAATNKWVCGGTYKIDATTDISAQTDGSKELSGELTTVRITAGNGTDTFDGGTINIQYDNPDLAVSYNGTIPAGVTEQSLNGTKVSASSAATHTFTIPSGVKQFTVQFDTVDFGAGATGTWGFTLGDAGGIENTGYRSLAMWTRNAAVPGGTTPQTTGFYFTSNWSSYTFDGSITFTLVDSATNTWVAHASIMASTGVTDYLVTLAGSKSLSGELTQVEIDLGGAAADSGNINVLYENPDLDLGSSVLSGSVVQVVRAEDKTYQSGTTTMPYDDTIPQNTEGTEFITASITPTDAANLLHVQVNCTHLVHSSASSGVQSHAIFLDSETDARAAGTIPRTTAAGGVGAGYIDLWMTAGQATSMTFKWRCGGNAGGTTYINGNTTSRRRGGVGTLSMMITEYKA